MTVVRLAPRLAVGVLAVVVGSAAPAAADPAKPSDVRSEISGIEPPVDGIDVDIVGGDSFLHLHVEAGHDVVVEGYEGEPWLHIETDGTVLQNRSSPATYLNEDRYGDVPDPDVDAGASPEWERIDDDGDHVWHDYRIHFMSPDLPAGARRGEVFADWTVPMTVDGRDVEVAGTLTLENEESLLPWAAIGIVSLALVLRAARRRAIAIGATASTLVASLAVVVGAGQRAATPAAAGGTPLVVVIPAIALAAGIVALALRPRPVAVVCLLASTAALGGWALLRLSVLTHPVLPTDLPPNLDRVVTAGGLGVVIATAIVAINSGALQPVDRGDGR